MPIVDPSAKLIIEVDEILTQDEASALIDRIDAGNPSVAPINTPRGPQDHTGLRNNERVIFDDVQLASDLCERLREYVHESCHGGTFKGLNERFRCYRYKPGMRFGPHLDGPFVRNESERSYYSALFYLNEVEEGGDTVFFTRPPIRVSPAMGRALLFQHPITHEGAEVTAGIKYVLRSDLMYVHDTP